MSGSGSDSGRRRRTFGGAAVSVSVVAVAGITLSALGGGDGAARQAPQTGRNTTMVADGARCKVGKLLVPQCGALWGVSPDADGLAKLERLTGRKFDLVQYWHGIDQGDVPRPAELKAAKGGRILHYNFAAKEWGKGPVQYSTIAAGKYDSAIDRQARNFKKFGKPVFVTFDHEADQLSRRARGTPGQYVKAWRHIHDRYRRAGAANVVWVWVVTGYPANFGEVPGLYPGNTYVDWLSWEAENGAGCPASNGNPKKAQSFKQLMTPYYTWLNGKGAKAGIDAKKPYMITGMGTILYPSKPSLSANWYKAVPGVLTQYPKIKAVQLWNDTLGPNCDFRITTRSSITKAFAQAGQAPLVNPDMSGH